MPRRCGASPARPRPSAPRPRTHPEAPERSQRDSPRAPSASRGKRPASRRAAARPSGGGGIIWEAVPGRKATCLARPALQIAPRPGPCPPWVAVAKLVALKMNLPSSCSMLIEDWVMVMRAARLQNRLVAARRQRQVFAAEQAVARDLGARVLGQLDRIGDGQSHFGKIILRVDPLVGHGADLDTGDPHVRAHGQTGDVVESRFERITRRRRARPEWAIAYPRNASATTSTTAPVTTSAEFGEPSRLPLSSPASRLRSRRSLPA